MYQALYRKYRPQTFDEVVGQEGVTRTLLSQLQTGRLSHAYLFTGSRGTGKTSCAKILAKAVNCEHPVNGNPCNCCAACRSIDNGSCMDVLEIDAASNNSVDNIRDLRNDAIYSPSEVRHRVYIIDEVHMLSISAFNALLKIIEEPPEHLIFILATTELHKVPATILSRCQRFSFRRLDADQIARRLQYISAEEHFTLEPQAGRLLGRLADGAMRDGVSLLDQCASSSVGAVTADTVYQCLGLAGQMRTAALMAAIAAKDTKAALQLYDTLYAEGKDVAALLDELCALSRDLLILKTAPEAGLSMLSGVCTEDETTGLKDRFSTGELVFLLKQLEATASSLTRGGKTRMAGELCLIRLTRPELSLDGAALNARLTHLEEALASGTLMVQAAPQIPPEDVPPPPDDGDAPPPLPGEAVAEAAPQEEDLGCWPELSQRLHQKFGPPLSGFFSSQPDAPIQGNLRGDVLELNCATDFVCDLLTRDIQGVITQEASAFLRKPVRVRVRNAEEQPRGSGSMDQLLDFGKQHGNIIDILK